jgi:hypothetical protein
VLGENSDYTGEHRDTSRVEMESFKGTQVDRISYTKPKKTGKSQKDGNTQNTLRHSILSSLLHKLLHKPCKLIKKMINDIRGEKSTPISLACSLASL